MYEQYEKTMKRFRVLLRGLRGLVIAVAALFLLAGFVIFGAGIPIGAVRCDSVTYGQQPSASVRAFAKEVKYEYRSRDGAWSVELPLPVERTGTYIVRVLITSPDGTSAGAKRIKIRNR